MKTIKLYGKLMRMTGEEKYSREQYLNHECTHREFYSQFVNDFIKKTVERSIGIERILKSKDGHLNDIPLREWDALYINVTCTQAEQKCILKEAARQLEDEYLSVMIPLPF